jgi:hypothetical protein
MIGYQSVGNNSKLRNPKEMTGRIPMFMQQDDDTKEKISLFQRLCGTIRRTLYNKIRKDTQVKLYKIMAVSSLLHGSEAGP